MSLERRDPGRPKALRPLRTGLRYTPRENIDDFDLPDKVAEELAEQLVRIDRYHGRFDLKSRG